MKNKRNAILECLREHTDDDFRLVSALELLLQDQGSDAYAVLFNVLTNLDLEPKEAESSWKEVVQHWENLCATLGRKVNVRTALCDYFCSINKVLHNPKVIEIHLFERTDRRSKYDNLTNLFNRHYFEEVLDREYARASRHEAPLSVILLDLDNFKTINDQYGHPAGDAVLKHIAAVIIEAKRTEDIACRYGGEEIILILPETDKLNALVLGERIRRMVEENVIRYKEHNFKITLSGGIAAFPQDAITPDFLVKRSDHALYHAKASGKNMISSYSKNNRRYVRVSFPETLEVTDVNCQDQQCVEGNGKNISRGGVLFSSTHPLSLGTKIKLSLPINQKKPLNLYGNVVRVNAKGQDNFDIGASFLEPEKNIADAISGYVTTQMALAN